MTHAVATLGPRALDAEPMQVFTQMRTAIDVAATLAETREVRHRIEAIRQYAREAQARELESLAREARLHAERKAGEFLLVAFEKGERRGRGGDQSTKTELCSLDDLGITKKQSAAWQQIARMTAQEFDARLQRLRGMKRTASTNSFLASGAAMSSNSDEWLTPPEIVQAVLAVLGEIDLDPCSNARREQANVPARNHIIKTDDGLTRRWLGRIYMNPPYGDAVSLWVAKLTRDLQAGEVEEAIALVAARTDTAWFSKLADAALICFVRGRLRFGAADGSKLATGAPFPSALFYLGPHREKFARVFREIGSLFVPYASEAQP